MSGAPRPYLSIVLSAAGAGSSGARFSDLIDALAFNDRRLAQAGVPYEIVFVEWPGALRRRLAGVELRRVLPQLDERLMTWEVDARYDAAFSQSDAVAGHEFIARNVGIRRSVGSYILSTAPGTLFSREVIALLEHRALRPMLLYRATSVDLKPGLDTSHVDDEVLADPGNQLAVRPLDRPMLCHRAGDFLLLDRLSWWQLRGFNEVYRVEAAGADTNFCLQAHHWGLLAIDTGGRAYRASRLADASFDSPDAVERHRQATAWSRHARYENPPGWGIGDAPVLRRGPRDFRLEFDDAAVPALVALRSISAGPPPED